MLFKTPSIIIFRFCINITVISEEKSFSTQQMLIIFIELHFMIIHLARDILRARNDFFTGIKIENFNLVIENFQLKSH